MRELMIRVGDHQVVYLNPEAVSHWKPQQIGESPTCLGAKREGCCVTMREGTIFHEVHLTAVEFSAAWRAAIREPDMLLVEGT